MGRRPAPDGILLALALVLAPAALTSSYAFHVFSFSEAEKVCLLSLVCYHSGLQKPEYSPIYQRLADLY